MAPVYLPHPVHDLGLVRRGAHCHPRPAVATYDQALADAGGRQPLLLCVREVVEPRHHRQVAPLLPQEGHRAGVSQHRLPLARHLRGQEVAGVLRYGEQRSAVLAHTLRHPLEEAKRLWHLAGDVTAVEVLANIDAMAWAVECTKPSADIRLDDLLEVHRRLLTGGPASNWAGVVREEQNWIGASAYHPCTAAYVPPPPEAVPSLLADLVAFCNSDGLPAVAQAALAHAQFETIHPFVDGNGRTGRALIHMVLRRRGMVSRTLPPVSLVLSTWSRDYETALMQTRYAGSPDSEAARVSANRWMMLFAAACRRAAEDVKAFEDECLALQRTWRQRVGPVRSDSATDRILKSLPGAPILTVQVACGLTGRSVQSVNEAVARLVEAKVLKQTTVGRRNRAFETPEVIRSFIDLERRPASPMGDTRLAPPARPVPRRR